MNKSHRLHDFAFQHTAIRRLGSQLAAGHDLLCFLAMKSSLSRGDLSPLMPILPAYMEFVLIFFFDS